jgi:hypothetical protein
MDFFKNWNTRGFSQLELFKAPTASLVLALACTVFTLASEQSRAQVEINENNQTTDTTIINNSPGRKADTGKKDPTGAIELTEGEKKGILESLKKDQNQDQGDKKSSLNLYDENERNSFIEKLPSHIEIGSRYQEIERDLKKALEKYNKRREKKEKNKDKIEKYKKKSEETYAEILKLNKERPRNAAEKVQRLMRKLRRYNRKYQKYYEKEYEALQNLKREQSKMRKYVQEPLAKHLNHIVGAQQMIHDGNHLSWCSKDYDSTSEYRFCKGITDKKERYKAILDEAKNLQSQANASLLEFVSEYLSLSESEKEKYLYLGESEEKEREKAIRAIDSRQFAAATADAITYFNTLNDQKQAGKVTLGQYGVDQKPKAALEGNRRYSAEEFKGQVLDRIKDRRYLGGPTFNDHEDAQVIDEMIRSGSSID